MLLHLKCAGLRCAGLAAACWLVSCGGGPPAPSRISLPDGFQPEGIASQGDLIYVGSIPTGAVYRADVRTGSGAVLVPAATGRAAIGLKVAGGRIFVAGGATGQAFVYDADTGADLAAYTLAPPGGTFINDVVIAGDAAWFTDSQNAVLYRVGIPPGGTLGGQEAVSALSLTGDFQLQAGATNLNGIAFTGSSLVAVQTGTGFLFLVDPATGVTRRIDLGAETLLDGDGLLLEGRTLFAVQNQLDQVAVVDLSADFTAGTVRVRLSVPGFDVPTTIAAAGGHLYAVNARFGITATPQTQFDVVRFDQP